jgi:transcription antitermination factor NusG
MGGFSREKGSIAPNKKPAFSKGTSVRIVSNRHPWSGRTGVIVEVNPSQSHAIYMVEIDGWGQLIPETMLERTT